MHLSMNKIFLFLVTLTQFEMSYSNVLSRGEERQGSNSLSRTISAKDVGYTRKLGISWNDGGVKPPVEGPKPPIGGPKPPIEGPKPPIEVVVPSHPHHNRTAEDREYESHSYHTTHSHGAPCKVASAEVIVGCKTFAICKEVTNPENSDMDGVILQETCEQDYFPVKMTNQDNVHVFCKHWEDLTVDRRQEILADPVCAYCGLVEEGPCSSQFRYRDSKGVAGPVNDCPPNTIIDVQRKGCFEPCETTGTLLAACKSNGKCSNAQT